MMLTLSPPRSFREDFGGRIVDQNFLLLDQLLDAGAADVEVRGEELVEALAGGSGRDGDGGGEVSGHCGGLGWRLGEAECNGAGYTVTFFLHLTAKISVLLELRGIDLI